MKPIIARKRNFNQVCVWPGTVVGADGAGTFEVGMKAMLGVRVQYLEEVLTKPDYEGALANIAVPGTGGRNDVIFAVHADDVDKFAVSRMSAEIRWIEDVLEQQNNNNRHMYDCERLDQYRSW